MDVEATIEQLKGEFKTVKFIPGTVGFAMRRGNVQILLPYMIFNDPNWAMVIVIAVTQLETAPQQITDLSGSLDWPPSYGH